jgi:hypothetical protein
MNCPPLQCAASGQRAAPPALRMPLSLALTWPLPCLLLQGARQGGRESGRSELSQALIARM